MSGFRYGVELGRLRLARNEIKQGLEQYSRGVAKAVVDDVKVCLDISGRRGAKTPLPRVYPKR